MKQKQMVLKIRDQAHQGSQSAKGEIQGLWHQEDLDQDLDSE
jgi:hypothetical protein